MTALLERLIATLREELEQYGEMLALLDQEQEQVISRHAEDLVQTVQAIADQGELIQAARQRRTEARCALARHLRQADDAPFSNLLPLLPAEYRPLVEALVQENNHLLFRVQQRARQNHLLLNRCLHLMQRLISSLCPSGTSVYSGNGTLHPPSLPRGPLYEAVG